MVDAQTCSAPTQFVITHQPHSLGPSLTPPEGHPLLYTQPQTPCHDHLIIRSIRVFIPSCLERLTRTSIAVCPHGGPACLQVATAGGRTADCSSVALLVLCDSVFEEEPKGSRVAWRGD